MSEASPEGTGAREADLDRLQDVLGHRFADRSLLELALTHESYANERQLDTGNNERLEFLGDAVLGLVVCQYLYERHRGLSEGRLAQIKAHLVSTSHLAREARAMNLGDYLLLGRGEDLSEGRSRRNVLADTLEAVIGALYLDGGLPVVQPFVLGLLQEAMDLMEGSQKDFKSLLQEHTQRLHKSLPRYLVVAEDGPPHDRMFRVEVDFLGEVLGTGAGRSKREASQKAAQQALEVLRRRAGFDLEWDDGGMPSPFGEGEAASDEGSAPAESEVEVRTFEPPDSGRRDGRLVPRAGGAARPARRRRRGARRRPGRAVDRAARRRARQRRVAGLSRRGSRRPS